MIDRSAACRPRTPTGRNGLSGVKLMVWWWTSRRYGGRRQNKQRGFYFKSAARSRVFLFTALGPDC